MKINYISIHKTWVLAPVFVFGILSFIIFGWFNVRNADAWLCGQQIFSDPTLLHKNDIKITKSPGGTLGSGQTYTIEGDVVNPPAQSCTGKPEGRYHDNSGFNLFLGDVPPGGIVTSNNGTHVTITFGTCGLNSVRVPRVGDIIYVVYKGSETYCNGGVPPPVGGGGGSTPPPLPSIDPPPATPTPTPRMLSEACKTLDTNNSRSVDNSECAVNPQSATLCPTWCAGSARGSVTGFGSGNGSAFQPNPALAPTNPPQDLGSLIARLFDWSIRIVGLAIFLSVFYAGFLWTTAAGDPGRVGQAKGIIKNAVLGAILLFSAVIILNTLNPDLVNFSGLLPGVPTPTSSTTP